MEYKINLGEGEQVEWKDIADMPEFKNASPVQKAEARHTFLKQMSKDNPGMKDEDVKAFYSHANDVERPENAKAQEDVNGVVDFTGNLAHRALNTVVPEGQVQKVREGMKTIKDWSGEAPDRKPGVVNSALNAAEMVGKTAAYTGARAGEMAMDYGTSPMDLATAGQGSKLKLGSKAWSLLGKINRAPEALSAIKNMKVGEAAGKVAEGAKGLYSKAGEAVSDLKSGIVAGGEHPDAAALRAAMEEEAFAKKNLTPESALPAPRGALPDGGALAKPARATEAKSIQKESESRLAKPAVEPEVEPASDSRTPEEIQGLVSDTPATPKRPLSEADLRAAAKAGEAELKAAPKDPMLALAEAQKASKSVKQTAEELKAEKALEKELSEAVEGRVPKAPVKEGSLLSKIGAKANQLLHGGTKKFIDPDADVKALGLQKTHDMSRSMNDRGVAKFSEDMAPAEKALTSNLKDAADKSLWNNIYNLRSMQEMWDKEGLDYGKIGSKAASIIEKVKTDLIAKGQTERWNRINAAVEQFADATRDVGTKRLGSLVDEKTAAEWSAKHRYYRSFQNYDADAAKMVHGEEGVAGNTLPSMDDYATGFMEKRVGGAAINDDPFYAFQQSHWRKIMAGQKKELIDTAVSESAGLMGKDLTKEMEMVGGKGWGTYKTADGKVHPMPEPVIDFLTKADSRSVSIFNEMAKAMNPISRRGYLDLNVRYYPGMVSRDIADTVLRAPGYLTSQTEWLAKKLGAATGLKEKAPDLEYILNPAPWLRGLKASWRVNFGKAGKNTDAIFSELEKQGALQTGTVQHAMRTENLKLLYPEDAGGKVKQLAGGVYEGMGRVMKAWDDTIRVGNALRNTPQELRGLKNMKNVMSLEHLPKGMISDPEMARIVRNTHIDFKMQGDGMRDLKFLNPFLNPAIQDKYQTLQYAKNQPASFALTTAAFMAAASASYMKWKAKPEGKLLNPRDTQRFILVDTGIRSKEGGAYALPAVMIPDSIQPIWIALRNAIDVASEKSPEFKAILKKNYAGLTASQGAGAMANISGPLVAMFETMINHSFYTGKPVEGRYSDTLSSGLRAGKNVPNVFRYVGEKTGLSPDKMAYLNRGILGAPGQSLANNTISNRIFSGVKLPMEGTEKPVKLSDTKGIVGRSFKNLPKSLGVVREQKYDSSYDRSQQMMEPTLSKSADAREIIRTYGERFGNERDPEMKKAYLEHALEAYKQYLASLAPEERTSVAKFEEIFGTAVKRAMESAITGDNPTMKSLKRRFPGVMRAIETPKEEGQGQ